MRSIHLSSSPTTPTLPLRLSLPPWQVNLPRSLASHGRKVHHIPAYSRCFSEVSGALPLNRCPGEQTQPPRPLLVQQLANSQSVVDLQNSTRFYPPPTCSPVDHDCSSVISALTFHPHILSFYRNLNWPYVSRLRLSLRFPLISTFFSHSSSQLRDLVICPHERGVVNYVQGPSILEQNLFRSGSKRAIANLPFTPNTLSALRLSDSTNTLIAAGGQDAELHLSLHSSSPSSSASSSSSHHRSSRPHWQYQTQLQGSINNSVMLTSLSLTKANVSSVEPRVAVSNNDCSVKFFEVNIRSTDSSPAASRLKDLGILRIDVPVNHCKSFSEQCDPLQVQIIHQHPYLPTGEPSCPSVILPKCTSTIYPVLPASPSNQSQSTRLCRIHHQFSPINSILHNTLHLLFQPHFQLRIRQME